MQHCSPQPCHTAALAWSCNSPPKQQLHCFVDQGLPETEPAQQLTLSLCFHSTTPLLLVCAANVWRHVVQCVMNTNLHRLAKSGTPAPRGGGMHAVAEHGSCVCAAAAAAAAAAALLLRAPAIVCDGDLLCAQVHLHCHDVPKAPLHFIHCIVQHLPQQVVQAPGACTADVHAWALAYRVQPLQHLCGTAARDVGWHHIAAGTQGGGLTAAGIGHVCIAYQWLLIWSISPTLHTQLTAAVNMHVGLCCQSNQPSEIAWGCCATTDCSMLGSRHAYP
jgi:hypothetical protein